MRCFLTASTDIRTAEPPAHRSTTQASELLRLFQRAERSGGMRRSPLSVVQVVLDAAAAADAKYEHDQGVVVDVVDTRSAQNG